ncbi:MAG TPA: BON domain-containing protein [Desulfosarcina sp.]|nr:BON domain-containing protein [Desulfosarcina sp.]
MKTSPKRTPGSGYSGIHLVMDDDRATLKGVVDSLWKRLKAAEMIAANRRVANIANHLVIVPTNSGADRRLAVTVVDAVYAVDGVGTDDVNVRVSYGVVTLTGVVVTPQARRAAGEAAGRIAGVRRVSNQLVVGGRKTLKGGT